MSIYLERPRDLGSEVDAVGVGHLLLEAMVEDKAVLPCVGTVETRRVLVVAGELEPQDLGEPGGLGAGVVFTCPDEVCENNDKKREQET